MRPNKSTRFGYSLKETNDHNVLWAGNRSGYHGQGAPNYDHRGEKYAGFEVKECKIARNLADDKAR